MSDPDWVYGGNARWQPSERPGGTYSIDGFDGGVEFHSGLVPFDHLPNPGMFYVGAAYLPMTSRLARLGVRGTHTQVTDEAEATATIHLRRGPLGWIARRWINRHQLQVTVQIFRPEWGEWRTEIGEVRVKV